MKNRIMIYICLVLAFCCCFSIASDYKNQSVFADEESVYFSVVGQACQEVSPDTVKVYVTAECRNEDSNECKNCVFSSYDENVKKLTEFGVDANSIVTQSFFTFPEYNFSDNQFKSYRAELRYSFVVNELDKLEEIFEGVISDGVSTVRNICYEVSNKDEIYNNVLSMAVENAKEKARILTGNEDVEIVKIHEEGMFNQTLCKTEIGENGRVSICAIVKAFFKK